MNTETLLQGNCFNQLAPALHFVAMRFKIQLAQFKKIDHFQKFRKWKAT